MPLIDKKAAGLRLIELQKVLKLNSRQFALKIEGDPSMISKMEKGEKITENYQDKIKEKFGVNMKWLLLGQGEMFGEDIPNTTNTVDNGEPNVKSTYTELTMYHLSKSNEKNAEANLILTKLLEAASAKQAAIADAPGDSAAALQTTFQALREFVIDKFAEVSNDTPQSVGAQLGKKQAEVLKRVKKSSTPLG